MVYKTYSIIDRRCMCLAKPRSLGGWELSLKELGHNVSQGIVSILNAICTFKITIFAFITNKQLELNHVWYLLHFANQNILNHVSLMIVIRLLG